MTTVVEIEEAVARLTPGDLASFRAWFDAFDAERFDQRIARDEATGKLRGLAREALSDLREGRVRDL